MNHLYTTMLPHDDIYNDTSILPSHCTGYIIRKHDVSVTYSDEPSYNTLSTNNIVTYLSMLRTNVKPLPKASKLIDNDTLYYEQCDITTLCKMYDPLIHSLAKSVHTLTGRYFLQEDLVQDAYLVVSLLYKKGYYVHGKLIKQAYMNRVRYKLRKEPTRWDVVSLTSPVPNKHQDETVTLAETLADPTSLDFIDEITLDDVSLRQKEQLLTVISRRQYDEYVRYYRTNTVPTSMGKTIQKIRQELGLE